MRILVCGGRDFRDHKKMWATLSAILCERWPYGGWPDPTWYTIIGGKARGADTLGEQYAEEMLCGFMAFPADWEKHGRAAGPIRNMQMLTEGKPDLVVAFPGGTGTAHMVSISRKAGVEVIEVE